MTVFLSISLSTDIYIKRVAIEAALLDPKGPLFEVIPSASIIEANKEVPKL